jgi:hypothetical protein
MATSSSGCALIGHTHSRNMTFGDVNVDASELFVLTVDADEDVEWVITMGGSGDDVGCSISAAQDGGWFVSGYTNSQDDEFTRQLDDQSRLRCGAYDGLVAKIRPNGSVAWRQFVGGTLNDFAYGVESTKDGGCIVSGYSESSTGDFDGTASGNHDAFLAKFDSTGTRQWIKVYGGSGADRVYSVAECRDKGYVFSGYTESVNGIFRSSQSGRTDAVVVRVDDQGGVLWTKTLGGTGADYGAVVKPAAKGGILVLGSTASADGDFSGVNHIEQGAAATRDVFVAKLDDNGNVVWRTTIGGSANEVAGGFYENDDGSVMVTGYTHSDDGDFEDMNHGVTFLTDVLDIEVTSDIFVTKLDSSGNLVWSRTYGGANYEQAKCIIPRKGGGYLITGFTESINGDFRRSSRSPSRRYNSSTRSGSLLGGLVVAAVGAAVDNANTQGLQSEKDIFLLTIDENGERQ